MQLDELISGARDVVSAKRVYGDPYEKNGLTVIPAATVRGGGGGGGAKGDGDDADAEVGAGGGFGLTARPSGAWIIDGQIIALTAILVVGRILLAHSERPEAPRRRLRLPRRAHR